jgi:hypothetical protein
LGAPFSPHPLRQAFAVGARVSVSAACAGFRNDACGVICDGPDPVATVQGEDYWYWVRFDEPQHDSSGDGPYYKAQILSRCLAHAS